MLGVAAGELVIDFDTVPEEEADPDTLREGVPEGVLTCEEVADCD